MHAEELAIENARYWQLVEGVHDSIVEHLVVFI
jgi:hypothetical protein